MGDMMKDKDLFFVSAILSMGVFTIIFFLISKYVMKGKRRLQIVVASVVGACIITIITIVWLLDINIGVIQQGIISGMSGCILGTLGGISNKKS